MVANIHFFSSLGAMTWKVNQIFPTEILYNKIGKFSFKKAKLSVYLYVCIEVYIKHKYMYVFPFEISFHI